MVSGKITTGNTSGNTVISIALTADIKKYENQVDIKFPVKEPVVTIENASLLNNEADFNINSNFMQKSMKNQPHKFNQVNLDPCNIRPCKIIDKHSKSGYNIDYTEITLSGCAAIKQRKNKMTVFSHFMHRIYFTPVLLISLLLLLACPDDDGNIEPLLHQCLYETNFYPWSETNIEGVSITPLRTLLATNAAGISGTNYLLSGTAALDVSLRIEERGSNIIFKDNTNGGCSDILDFPVTIEISASNLGGEVFTAVLETAASRWLQTDELTIAHAFNTTNISGSFTAADYTTNSVRGYTVNGLLTEDQKSISILILTEGSDGSGGTAWAGQEQAITFSW